METRIISAFPGLGKSYYFRKNLGKGDSEKCLDFDPLSFTWIDNDDYKKIKNPEFPGNYIEFIKENIGKYKFIFVPCHRKIRQALKKSCLYFYLIYPGIVRKEEFIDRYRKRGDEEGFIRKISKNWESWIEECASENGCKKIVLTEGNLSDFLKKIDNN